MVHRAAASGFEQGSDHYRRGRPSYHPDLVARFVSSFGDGPMVEIGAGTGIFTSQLVAAGVDVIAIEPVESMRAALVADHPDLDVRAGTAEQLPVDTNACTTVVVAQAFHWFDHGPALDEIHRILRPGGHLVTVWNVKEGDAPWYQRYMAIIDRLADDTPRHRDQVWRRAIDDDPRYRLVDDWQIDNTVPADLEAVVDRALSTSFVAALPEHERASVADEIRGALNGVELPVPFPYRGELQAWVADPEPPAPGPDRDPGPGRHGVTWRHQLTRHRRRQPAGGCTRTGAAPWVVEPVLGVVSAVQNRQPGQMVSGATESAVR